MPEEKRLTLEDLDQSGAVALVGGRIVGKQMFLRIMAEMRQYKTIEKELGIDLVTFFKYLSANVVYIIKSSKEIERVIVRSIDKKRLIVFEEGFYWGECDFTLYFKEYGTKWALTKEELEHE